MKKIILIASILFSGNIYSQSLGVGKFRSTTNSNIGQMVNVGPTTVTWFNVINAGSDTLKVSCYDKSTIATYTNTPFPTFQVLPFGEICPIPANNPAAFKFTNGLSIRTTKGGNTGRADSYTVSPTYSPIIEIKY